MGANGHTVSSRPTPAALRQALGHVPPREAVGEDGVTVAGGPNPVVAADTSGVTPDVYGSDTSTAVITVDEFGRIVDVVDTDIDFPAPPAVGVHSVTFGAGAPGGTPAAGDLYFDTTLATYVGYVGNGGTWHQF